MTSARRVTAVLFDLDGTLVDSMATLPAAYADAVRELGGRPVTIPEVVSRFALGPTAAVLSSLLDRPTDEDDLECFYRHVETRASRVRAFPGIPELLRTLREAEVPVAVFTGATHRTADLVLRHSSLLHEVDVVVGGDEVPEVKPSPAGIHLACRLLDVASDDVAYVGDVASDMACARAAGSLAVLAAWGGDLSGEADADVIAQHPSDLLEVLRPTAGPG